MKNTYIMANNEEKIEEITEEKSVKKTPNAAQKKIKALEEVLKKTKEDLDKSKEELAKSKEDSLKLLAEFETFRRRNAEDRLNLIGTASADVIKGLLPVLDDFERAMKMLENSADEAAKEGTALIYNKLMAYLKGKGLEVIDAKGKEFDTDFHEAVSQFPAPEEKDKGMVLEVVQTGYILNGKVIRYAKVVVGA